MEGTTSQRFAEGLTTTALGQVRNRVTASRTYTKGVHGHPPTYSGRTGFRRYRLLALATLPGSGEDGFMRGSSGDHRVPGDTEKGGEKCDKGWSGCLDHPIGCHQKEEGRGGLGRSSRYRTRVRSRVGTSQGGRREPISTSTDTTPDYSGRTGFRAVPVTYPGHFTRV